MAAATKADFDGDLDRLYQLPLGEFTSARNELARELRAQGEREKADEIKQLRKPTAAVWVVNQLARERPLDVQRLLNAGEALTKSQAPEARRDEQRAVDQLAKGAREIAERSGIGSSALGKATETLRAASLTAGGRELLKRGRLTEELEPPGFEALAGLEGLGRQRVRQLRAEERELATAARVAAREADRAEAEAGAARSRAADAREKAQAIS